MNELDGDIRRFLTRLTDASPEAPDAGALAGHRPSPSGRPVARLVGALAVVALAIAGVVAVRERGDAPPAGATSTAAQRTIPAVVCAYVPVTVPQFVGLTIDDARARAAEPCTGLVLAARPEYTDAAPGGTVTGQEPQAGVPTKPGAEIIVYVAASSDGSTGSTSFPTCRYELTMPNLVGLSREKAEENLRGWCFGGNVRVAEVQRATDDTPPGAVLGQWPDPGADVEQGVEVRLIVAGSGASSGQTTAPPPPPIGMFELPDGGRRGVLLLPQGICLTDDEGNPAACDEPPPVLSPLVVFFGGGDPQEFWGTLDPGLTIRVERNGVAVAVQQTTQPVAGHLAFYGLAPAGGRLTIQLVDGSGAVVKQLDDVAR